MKNTATFTPIIILIMIFLPSILFAQAWVDVNKPAANLYEAQDSFNKYWEGKTPERGQLWKQFKRLESFWEPRVYPTGNFPDPKIVLEAWNACLASEKEYKNNLAGENEWTFLGPKTQPQQADYTPPPGMGRMNCITFDPNSPNILWAGASFGGIWKSLDAGRTWVNKPLTDFMSIGISDIAIAKNNKNIMYAATGDADASGVLGINFCFSVGVIKSTDAGETWIPTSLAAELSNYFLINRLLVDPSDYQIVYAAANTGILKSTDGGDSWFRLMEGFARDIEFQPGNTDVLIASFRTQTGAQVYKVDQNTNQAVPLITNDLANTVRCELTVAGNYMYAIAAYYDNGFHSVWRSSDAGNSWTMTAHRSSAPNYMSFVPDGSQGGGQGLYDLCIAANPSKPNEVYIGGVNLWKSVDGGNNFALNAEWTGGYISYGIPWVHADQHALEFAANGILYSCNDGGIHKTSNGGSDWIDISSGLEVTQFYRMSSSKTDEKLIIAGSQDNGTHVMSQALWKNVLGGDGMDCLIDHTAPNFMYASLYYGNLNRSTDGGKSFFKMLDSNVTHEQGAWITPIVMDPTDPRIIFAGYLNVWKSIDRGVTWTRLSNFTGEATMRSLAVAPSDHNYIYAGYYGQLITSTNGGKDWYTLLSNTSAAITGITVDPENPMHLWVTFSGYSESDKVREYSGGTWKNLSDGLPNIPVNCLVLEENTDDRIYIGTDIGVFYRDDNVDQWISFNEGLPRVVVNDMEIHYASGKLRAATYGRGMWERQIVDCNLGNPTITHTGDLEFCEGDSVILTVEGEYASYEWSNGETTQSIVVKTDGNFFCTVRDEENCVATTEGVTVNMNSVPNMKIRVSGDENLCEGDSLQLKASYGFTEYEWSTGAAEQNIWVYESGIYTVTGYTGAGCMAVSEEYEAVFAPAPDQPKIEKHGDSLVAITKENIIRWYYNGEIIPTAVKNFYLPDKDGYYTVEVTNENGCKSMSIVYDHFTSVKRIAEHSGITLSPNPTKDIVNISINSEKASDISLKLSDLNGINFWSSGLYKSQSDLSLTINLSDKAAGVYFLEIVIDGQVYFEKIVKK